MQMVLATMMVGPTALPAEVYEPESIQRLLEDPPMSVINTVASTLPDDDDHPYRTGAWRPNHREWDADDLEVEGELPADLDGVYLRNTENPVHPVDRHVPPVRRRRDAPPDRASRTAGRPIATASSAPTASSPNRRPPSRCGPGCSASPSSSKREDGWGARGRMKDASSTDVVVHNGKALTSFWQCGDVYQLDPRTLADEGKAPWAEGFPSPTGVSAHPKVDERTGRAARVRLRQGRPVPALRRGERRRAARALDRRAAPRPPPAARHGVHRALRDPQRPAAVLGPRPPRPGRAPAPLLPRPAEPLRDRPPPRHDGRHPLVRGRPHLRPALDQRLRGRRRGRARRLLPARPVPAKREGAAAHGERVPLPRPRAAAAPGPTAGGSTW